MKFITLYQETPVIKTPVGYRYETKYIEKFDNDGNRYLFDTKCPDDIKSEIYSYRHTVDINEIVRRFLYSGDESLIRIRNGVYGDFTDFPTTYGEFIDVINRGTKAFDSLPPEIREKFDYDINKFVAAIGSKEFNELFVSSKSEENVIKEKESEKE